MRPETNSAHRRRQRGIALLMTLAILALLLIMAMSFAYTSKTNRLAASVQADLVQARLMCDTGLSRVVAFMKYGCGPAGAGTFAQKTYPATSNAGLPFLQYGSTGQYYSVSQSPGDDADGLPAELMVPGIKDFLLSAIPADTAEWWHIKQDLNRDGNLQLTGRFAYLILDESGKIDAAAAVTPDWEPFCMTYDPSGNGWLDAGDMLFFYDINNDGAWNSSGGIAEGAEVRIGASLAELAIPDKFRSSIPVNGRDLNGDSIPDRTRWFSLQHLFKGASLTAAEYLTYAADSYDIEAYHDVGTGVDYHRFDVTGNAWDPNKTNAMSGWDELTTAMTGLQTVQWLDSSPVPFWNNNTDPAQGVAPVPPAAPGATGGLQTWAASLPVPQRYEALASLKDYNDNDLTPTCGNSGSTPGADYDFVGLEMSPYINEVRFEVGYGHRNPPPMEMGIFYIAVPQIEMVNPHDDPGGTLPNYPTTVDVTVQATVSVSPTPPGFPYASPLTLTWRTSAPVTVSGHSYATSILMLDSGADPLVIWTTPPAAPFSSPISVSITEVKVTVTSRNNALAPDGALLDYAHWSGDLSTSVAAGPTLAPPARYFASLEANDPRCNTRGDCWSWGTGWGVAAGTMGARNNAANPAAGEEAFAGDPKDACQADDSGLSTWYIRNAPMESLWELGAVHRGEPWRTIDLKSFSAGDAQLLSQCKVGPWTEVVGKFNANSPLPGPWGKLLEGLRRDTSYDDPTTGTTDVTVTGAVVAAAASSNPMAERGQIADLLPAMKEGSRDRELESTIGRIANLLTVRQNYFTVIVVGQSVKDLGAVDDGSDDVYEYETGKYCRVLAQQKIIATIYRDALRNRFRVERIEYLEEE